MIRIRQNLNTATGLQNVVILSLKDRLFTPESSLSWLLIVKNDYTKVENVTIIQNTSNSITSVDDKYAVRITEFTGASSLPNPLLGQIKLSPVGSFSYEIYQQNSTTNISKTNDVIQGLVESGKLYLSPNSNTQEEIQYTQYKDTDNDTNYIYVE